MSVRQDGMAQVVGGKNVDFGHTEVMMDILIFTVDDDARMTNRVFAAFVDPRVQRRRVGVMDLFSLSFIGNMMEFDGIGSASEEGDSRLQWINYLEVEEKLLQFPIFYDFLVPVTFPLYFEIVTLLLELVVFSFGAFVHFLQGLVRMYDGKSVSVF